MAVYKEGNGYRARVSISNGDGTYTSISTRRKTYKEAKDAEASLKAKVGNPRKGTSLDQLAMACFEEMARKRKKTTVCSYYSRWGKNISPYIGRLAIESITPETVRNWKRRLVNDRPELSHEYLHQCWSVLHLVFSYGRKAFGLSMDPVDRIGDFEKDPNVVEEDEPIDFWTAEQFEAFNKRVEEWMDEASPLSAQWMIRRGVWMELNILFYAGLRKGEANALLVSDWHDGERPYLSITKTVNLKLLGKGKALVTPPKTKGSVRRVPVPRILAGRIRRHLEKHLGAIDGRRNATHLCGGISYVKDTTLAIAKDTIEEELGLPHIRIHGLRHSYVSMLINAGADPMKVSKLIGDTYQMVIQVYGHLYRSTLDDVVSLIDSANQSAPAA